MEAAALMKKGEKMTIELGAKLEASTAAAAVVEG